MLTIISDVHGKYDSYFNILKRVNEKNLSPHNNIDCTLQIGDMGFNYVPLMQFDSGIHKFFAGNHDNYDMLDPANGGVPHNLGDYGLVTHGGVTFFFIRGAYSVDMCDRMFTYKRNLASKSWWWQEELQYPDMVECQRQYEVLKPSIVITHTCPAQVSELVGSSSALNHFGYPGNFVSQTQRFLQTLFEIHQPERWYFGHFHRTWKQKINGTQFRCLAELESLEIKQ